jgi:RimJ/RimL family protein N-acetyltransferase
VLGLHRIWAARSPFNEASARALSRVGMVEEGRIRDHVFVRGAWRNSLTKPIGDVVSLGLLGQEIRG